MHAQRIRRVPVERARNAKRLGQVLATPSKTGPATPTTEQPTTSSAPLTSATSTTSSESSAPTPSSNAHSSSSHSSATSPSSSSLATSSDTQSLTASTPSTSLVVSPVVVTSTSTALAPSSTSQTNATHGGLPDAAIGGIIAAAAVVGAALIVLFVRKTYLRRRGRQRISWSGVPGLGTDAIGDPKYFPDASEQRTSSSSVANTPQRITPPSPFVSRAQSVYSTPAVPLAHMQPPGIPSYPPATYNNPAPIAAYPTVPAACGPAFPHMMSHGPAGMGAPVSQAPMEATVQCAFVPNLPDELSITTGERVFVVEQYDDGWDLCANTRGERGMVPRECLEHIRIDQPDATWRNAGRTSSLNPDGQKY